MATSNNPHGQYTDAEIRKRPLMIFLAMTLIVVLLTAVGIWGLLSYYFAQDASIQEPANIYATERLLPTNAVVQGAGEAAIALKLLHDQEDAKLLHYQWVDRNAKTVQIPIDRAMERLVEKGLPVRDLGESQEVAN